MKHNVQIINKNTKATSVTSFCKCYLGMFCSHGRNRNQPIKFTLKINIHVFIWAERWFWKIVHKKDRQVIHWVTTNGTSVNEWQRVTNNKWYDEWQRVVKRETTSDKKWQRMTTSENEWSFWLIFFFFSNRRGTYHYAPKRNSLNTEEDLEERLLK